MVGLIINDYYAVNIKVWGACGRWFESSHPDWKKGVKSLA